MLGVSKSQRLRGPLWVWLGVNAQYTPSVVFEVARPVGAGAESLRGGESPSG